MKMKMILVLMLVSLLLSACILPPPFGRFPGHGRGGGNDKHHSSEGRGGRH